jgi:AraC-like DNA-binding protein
MLYLSHVPRPPLCDFVEYLWLLSDAPAHAKERIVPSGTLELVINLREDAIRIYDRTRTDECKTFPGMVVSGAYSDFFVIDTAEHALMMGVHFKPGGAFPFLRVRVEELSDRHVEVQSLWGIRARELREQLCAALTHEHRFRLLETALLERARGPLKHRGAVQVALDRFENEGARIGDVAASVGLSHRHFIELFRAEVGMTPKTFCRVRRFQRALTMVRRSQSPDWAKLATRCGYFDQSHLIREFLAFSGFAPSEFVRRASEDVKENHLVLG